MMHSLVCSISLFECTVWARVVSIDFMKTDDIRAHQASVDATKSEQRDLAPCHD
jgi:hypothetical protein